MSAWLKEVPEDLEKAGKGELPRWKTVANSAAQFWNKYEAMVKPDHFARVKSVFSGKPETFKSHRNADTIGDSSVHAHIPDEQFKEHAKTSQDLVLQHLLKHDPKAISYKNIKNADGSVTKEPHVTVYRGIAGDYAKKILDGFSYDPHHNELDQTRQSIPTLPFQSWSLRPDVARSFAVRNIVNQAKSGVILKKQLPLKDLLHEGFIAFDRHHEHPTEEELVFSHPGKIAVSHKNIAQVYSAINNMKEPGVREKNLGPTLKAAKAGKALGEDDLHALLMSGNPDYTGLAMNHPSLNSALKKKIGASLDSIADKYTQRQEIKGQDVKNLRLLLQHPLATSKQINKVSSNFGPTEWELALKHHPEKVTAESISQTIDRASRYDFGDFALRMKNLMHLPAFNKDHEDRILDWAGRRGGSVPAAISMLVESPYSSEELLDKATESHFGHLAALKHPKLNEKHLSNIIQDAGHLFPEVWAHPKINEKHVTDALADPKNQGKKFVNPTVAKDAIEVAKDAVYAAHEKGFTKALQAATNHPNEQIREIAKSLVPKMTKSEPKESDMVDYKLHLKSKHATPADLRAALQDENPYIRAIAAKHPNVTVELIKEIMAGNDEWLKSQLTEHNRLGKSEEFGPISFPKLLAHKELPQPSLLEEDDYQRQAPEPARSKKGYTFGTDQGAESPQLHSAVNLGHFGKITDPVAKEAAIQATKHHEGQHMIFRHLDQQFGRDNGSPKVIAHLLGSLDPEEKKTLGKMFAGIGGQEQYPKELFGEEAIAHIHNYLHDPSQQDLVHRRLNVDPEQFKGQIHGIYHKLASVAQDLTPRDIGIIRKSDDLTAWAESLDKNEDEVEHLADQLGLDTQVSEYINAIHLVCGKTVTLEEINKFVAHAGGDMLWASLMAAGLDSQQDKEAVERAVNFITLYKNEDELEVKVIVPLTNSAKGVADALNRAKDAKKIERIKLGGKHSSGALFAEDPDTQQFFLLKPEQKKNSPAMGMADSEIPEPMRECAFYAAAQVMGLGGDLPYSYLVSLDDKRFAAMEFLPMEFTTLEKLRRKDPHQITRTLQKYLDSGRIHKWAVLDYVLGDVDRHGNNLMVSQEDGRVKLIDHGSTFAGHAFNPGGDKDSFIPYYLRVWTSNKEFAKLPPEERMAAMPELNPVVDARVREWALMLDGNQVSKVISQFGIDPGPVLKRLSQVQADVDGSFSRYVNHLWAYPAN